jgi:hypothetical protein
MEQFARDAYGKAEEDYRRLMQGSLKGADLAPA